MCISPEISTIFPIGPMHILYTLAFISRDNGIPETRDNGIPETRESRSISVNLYLPG